MRPSSLGFEGRRGSSSRRRSRAVEDAMPRVLITVAATLENTHPTEGGGGIESGEHREDAEEQENVPPLPPPSFSPPPLPPIMAADTMDPSEVLEPAPAATPCCVESESIWGDNTSAVTTTKKTKKIKKKKK